MIVRDATEITATSRRTESTTANVILFCVASFILEVWALSRSRSEMMYWVRSSSCPPRTVSLLRVGGSARVSPNGRVPFPPLSREDPVIMPNRTPTFL